MLHNSQLSRFTIVIVLLAVLGQAALIVALLQVVLRHSTAFLRDAVSTQRREITKAAAVDHVAGTLDHVTTWYARTTVRFTEN